MTSQIRFMTYVGHGPTDIWVTWVVFAVYPGVGMLIQEREAFGKRRMCWRAD